MRTCTRWLLLGCLVSLGLGCDASNAPPTATPVAGTPAAAPQGAPGGPPQLNAPPPLNAPAPPPVQQTASEDLTKKGMAGKELGKGVLATPASVYLRIPDRLVFDNIKHALNLYKATNEHLPRTHEEFMTEIIQANNIQLPELHDGSRYVYVPEEGELKIEQKGR